MTRISSRNITKRRYILENLVTFGRKKDSRDSMASCEEYYNDIKEPESPGQEKGEKPKIQPQIQGKHPFTFQPSENLPPPLPPPPMASTSKFMTPLRPVTSSPRPARHSTLDRKRGEDADSFDSGSNDAGVSLASKLDFRVELA